MRRLSDIATPFAVGTPIFLVTRDGQILDGFRISSILLDQVMLDPPPLGAKPGLLPRSVTGADGPFDEMRAPRGGPCVKHMGDERRKADRGRDAASGRGIGSNSGSKQGFTIDGNRIKPNWCEGRRTFRAGYTTRKAAEAL